METLPRILIDYLKPKLVEYVLHNFISKWQEKEFKRTLSRLQPDTILSCIDFSQNYSMEVQDEVQSMHWHSQQIMILVHITYMWNPEYDEQVPESRILKETHYYVSDEKEHDSLYVQHAFKLYWEFLKQKSLYPKRHVVWSDGCSAQFKVAKCWYHIARYHNYTVCDELLIGCQMTWNYFAPGHGKGEVDGAGALLKRELSKEQIKPDARRI
jgi:hypothetical protein